jgi:oligopeptide/dipeptide ABC transporter ATP-binding protein
VTLLVAEGLSKAFALPGRRRLVAVNDVSLSLERGRTLAVVGESGCGKSTLGRLLLRLQDADAGRVLLDSAAVGAMEGAALRQFRRRVQVVFQDPFASLDPRQRIRSVLTRPMLLHGRATRASAAAQAGALMETVGLAPTQLDRFPHEFSGGQRQRIAIARALSVEPDVLICDEPVSALDVSVQAQIVNLLRDLQAERGLALLFISHDLAVVRVLAHAVMVMYAGRVVEAGPAERVFAAPSHPYTRALLDAAPRTDRGPRQHAPLAGEPPDPGVAVPGCRFAGRCAFAQDVCTRDVPALRPVDGGEHAAACHFAESLPPRVEPVGLPGALADRLAAYRRARAAEHAA